MTDNRDQSLGEVEAMNHARQAYVKKHTRLRHRRDATEQELEEVFCKVWEMAWVAAMVYAESDEVISGDDTHE